MTAQRDRLDLPLAEAARDAAWPATPDLRAGVMGRLGTVPPAAPARARVGRPRLLRAVALAALLAILAAGAAVALGYRLPGLDIVFDGAVTPPPAGSDLVLGAPMPVVEATAADRPRVLVPATLPAPDTAYRGGSTADPVVTLAWRADPGAPTLTGSTDLALVVMAVPGDVEEAFLSKVLGPGTTIEPVTVGGDRGWWISGAPHELLYLDPRREAKVLRSVVAGDTLVFARDGTLYRLESALGRDRTLEIAGSMR